MNILNQLPPSNGHSVFPPPRGPRPATSHDHHLLPAALSPLMSPPASSTTLRSFQPSRSTRPPPLIEHKLFSPAEEDKYISQLVQEYYYYYGDHLEHKLISPVEEPPAVLTLAVSVSSAVKLEAKQMDQIAKKMRRLTGFESLRVENTVDPSLIAGFVISYGVGDAHVIDLSVKGRLAELEAQLQSSEKSGGGGDGWKFPTGGDRS